MAEEKGRMVSWHLLSDEFIITNFIHSSKEDRKGNKRNGAISSHFILVWLPRRSFIKYYSAFCFQIESINQLKANFVYGEATGFFQLTAAKLFVHALKDAYSHLCGQWYYKQMQMLIISMCDKPF